MLHELYDKIAEDTLEEIEDGHYSIDKSKFLRLEKEANDLESLIRLFFCVSMHPTFKTHKVFPNELIDHYLHLIVKCKNCDAGMPYYSQYLHPPKLCISCNTEEEEKMKRLNKKRKIDEQKIEKN